jgi:hypothetical protein
MRWFFPAWNGDFRLEPVLDPAPEGGYREGAPAQDPVATKCRLVVLKPTAGEREILAKYLAVAAEKKWLEGIADFIAKMAEGDGDCEIPLEAKISDAGAELVRIMKPADRTITAVSFSDGRIKVAESAELKAVAKLAAEGEKKQAKAAASVARPTPCCPNCYTGAIAPATEVLLSFLDEEQHEQWARTRTLVAYGGQTGHRYLLAHRHTKAAERITRVCYDLDDQAVVHFHQHEVPPEEEILAAKLILEHREPWLRNEATMLGAGKQVFKNPFGGLMDGVADSKFTQAIGAFVRGASIGKKIGDQLEKKFKS